jgi:hypothetical protein
MLQLLYILAFTILAFLAIANLMRNLFTLGVESQRMGTQRNQRASNRMFVSPSGAIAHPELIDETGNLTNEPLLVMRSINVEDARTQLNALYDASPSDDGDSAEKS